MNLLFRSNDGGMTQVQATYGVPHRAAVPNQTTILVQDSSGVLRDFIIDLCSPFPAVLALYLSLSWVIVAWVYQDL